MEKIVNFVKLELHNDHSGHDFNHAQRVLNNALKIMKTTGGNEKIITACALLHDTIDEKLFVDLLKQEQKIIKLLENDFTKEEIEEVLFIIKNMSFHLDKRSDNLNFMIVQDADRLDAMGAIGIIRTIEFGASHNRVFYEEENLKQENGKLTFNHSTNTTLSHFYDKLLKLPSLLNTPYAKDLAIKRVKLMEEFLKNFYEELK